MSHRRPERTAADTGMLTTNAGGHLVVREVRVRVVEGPDTGLSLEIDHGTRIVGTGPGSDLLLTDPRVSRRHLEIMLLPRGVSIRDQQSRNGTFVGDSIVHQMVLPQGGLVRLGKSTVLEIAHADRPAATPPRTRLQSLVAASPAMTHALGVLARVAPTELAVLLEGESGVGKTAAATALHAESGRAGPLVVLDLSVDRAPADLQSAFAASRDGTLLVERVDRASATVAAAMLVALEARERAAAGGDPVPRIVATARENVRGLVEAGAFPRDLYFHLAAVRVEIPPLRDRPEDIPVLAEAFGAPLSEAALAPLRRDGWPGNVRALRDAHGVATAPVSAPDAAGPLPPYKEAKTGFERDYLERLLAEHDGNVSKASRASGIARSHLIELLKKHGLTG